MPRQARKPPPLLLPSFRITVIEHIEVEGKRFAHHETLFEADVAASYQTTTTMSPLLSATTILTCTLSAAQGQQLWHGLKDRYSTGQECAWFFHVGQDHGTMCIGYMTDYRTWQAADDRLTYALTFVDSGRQDFPVRHVVTT